MIGQAIEVLLVHEKIQVVARTPVGRMSPTISVWFEQVNPVHVCDLRRSSSDLHYRAPITAFKVPPVAAGIARYGALIVS